MSVEGYNLILIGITTAIIWCVIFVVLLALVGVGRGVYAVLRWVSNKMWDAYIAGAIAQGLAEHPSGVVYWKKHGTSGYHYGTVVGCDKSGRLRIVRFDGVRCRRKKKLLNWL